MRASAACVMLLLWASGCVQSPDQAPADPSSPITAEQPPAEPKAPMLAGEPQGPPDEPPAPAAAPPAPREIELPVERVIQESADPRGPPAIALPRVSLIIQQVSVPAGSVSEGEPFWKRIDENVVHPAVQDLLDRNGLRVGCVSVDELPRLERFLAQSVAASRPLTIATSTAAEVPLTLKRAVREQTIYYDLRREFVVRSYQDCDIMLLLEFRPSPRRPGEVYISICPVVRSLRTHVLPVSDIETMQVPLITPEKRFELGLSLDIPRDSVLVIAPSPAARSSMSLGSALFVEDGKTTRQETVLIITPHLAAPRADRSSP